LKVGKVLWVAGHSGPETADDSRTHFGIFAPGVTQLFPEGAIINLHPWEYNEVPVLLGTALGQDVPLVALHLTRPPIEIPDRAALGMPSHFEAARGAYIVRDYQPGLPQAGTFYVQGTSSMVSLVKLLPELEKRNLNVKIVYVASTQLFALQAESYRSTVVTPADRANSTIITTQARWLMHDWLFNKLADEYALSSDWDNRWRTGGDLPEVIEEAHLSPAWVLKGIERFVQDRESRLSRLQSRSTPRLASSRCRLRKLFLLGWSRRSWRRDRPVYLFRWTPNRLNFTVAMQQMSACSLLPASGLARFTLVCDQNTYAVLGRQVESPVSPGNLSKLKPSSWKGSVGADERSLAEVLFKVDDCPSTYLAVGSGTITDIARFCSHRTRNPFISLPTAPSVDGYALGDCSPGAGLVTPGSVIGHLR
jgi:hypothetical protein